MKIAVQTAPVVDAFRPETVESGFRMIREAGFDGVDLNLSKLLERYNSSGETDLAAAVQPFGEAAARWGLTIEQAHAPLAPWLADADTHRAMLPLYRQAIAICGMLGCPYLVIHPAALERGTQAEYDAEWACNTDLFGTLIPDLKAHRVICCLENTFTLHNDRPIGAVCAEPAEVCTYIDALNAAAGEDLFAFCLDTGHALVSGQDIGRFITQLGSRLAILHIHDNNGYDDQHLAPYAGRMDWERFCAALAAVDYRGVLSFETGAALKAIPEVLWPVRLRFIAQCGQYFAQRIEEQR